VKFARIMCPIDFSDYSQRALRYAALLVRRLEAQLTVLHVNEPLLVATDTVVYARRPEEETRAELRHFVDEALAGDEFHLPEVATLVAEGHPAEEIVKAADENGVDLIVMGSHGLSGYRKIFIGSTTERVLRRTFIPVAAVPLAESTFSLENALRPGAGPVLAAVDFSEPSRHAARMVADIANELGLGLLLLHIVKPLRTIVKWRKQAAASDEARIAEARQRLEKLAASIAAAKTLVLTGHPADDIAAAAIQRNASLVAMGLRGEGGLFAPSPGSIAYRTLCLAPMPILAVPAPRDADVARQSLRGATVTEDH
jgi:nucleotide-binding universal stress UspA family protein